MAGSPTLDKLFSLMTVKKAPPRGGTTITPTQQPAAPTQILPTLQYKDHLQTLYDNRTAQDARQLLQDMFKQDPDVSAAVSAYLTMADTRLTMLVYDINGQIDPTGTATLMQLVTSLTRQTDFTGGFLFKQNLATLCQELRYMAMLRGAVGGELIYDKNLVPSRIQQVDMKSVWWYEQVPGVYKPEQRVSGLANYLDLDIPTFFVAYHRRDPTKIYPVSDFVSVINTAAARQQVINELYRIMQVTGFPRIALKVLEDVLVKNAPITVRDDANELQKWAAARLGEVAASFSGIRSDMPFAHFDSIEPSVINETSPGAGVNIGSVIEVLNAQNQAALKTMATVIGRGSGATGTATVEARIASMSADQLNVVVKEFLDQTLSFALNSFGVQGFVECMFAPCELRPLTELEPQLTLKAARLKQDLSLGIISDEEYHLAMYGRLPPAGAPVLSGTGFMPASGATVSTDDVSPNQGSLDRSMVPGGQSSHKSDAVPSS